MSVLDDDLKAYRDAYDTFSSLASSNVRSLSYAGIALVWAFSNPSPARSDDISLHGVFALPLFLLVLALALDLAHYVTGALIWGMFARRIERTPKNARRAGAPKYLNWPTIAFFWTKVLAVAAAYVRLLFILWPRLSAL